MTNVDISTGITDIILSGSKERYVKAYISPANKS
jgi:hypothetical protein